MKVYIEQIGMPEEPSRKKGSVESGVSFTRRLRPEWASRDMEAREHNMNRPERIDEYDD